MSGKAYARLLCPVHHKIEIDKDEYDKQMQETSSWRCPKCRCVSQFDDEFFDHMHIEEETEEPDRHYYTVIKTVEIEFMCLADSTEDAIQQCQDATELDDRLKILSTVHIARRH